MTSRSRGMTMIELLAALAILGLLTAGIVSWTQASSSVAAAVVEKLPWEQAARAVLGRIHEDMLIGDFELNERASEEHGPRVTVVDNELLIQTRDHGRSIRRRYRWSAFAHELVQIAEPLDDMPATRILLDQVAEFVCELDEGERLVRVSIVSMTGQHVTRTFTLP